MQSNIVRWKMFRERNGLRNVFSMMNVILFIFSQYAWNDVRGNAELANSSSDTSVIVKATTDSINLQSSNIYSLQVKWENSIWSTVDELLEELRTQVMQLTIGKK